MENERTIRDQFGTILQPGDTVCFTLSMRIDSKPIVRATIKEFVYGKERAPHNGGGYNDWIIPEYIESSAVDRARKEKKLVQKVTPDRVVKCY